MKSVLIVENSNSSLIQENAGNNGEYILNGPFTEFNVRNRNDRIYTAEKFLPALNELNERINSLGVVYGEFDHPDVFDTSLSRSSHIVTKAQYVAEENRVMGEIKLLSTHWGKEAKALVNDKCPLFVSSRAAGVTNENGEVLPKKLFTYDIVADPGFASAKMTVKSLNESLGYKTENSNFRIYEMSDDSKINDLFNMNKNDYVTKEQLTEYSNYLVNEIASTKQKMEKISKEGKTDPSELMKLLESYDEMSTTNGKIIEYLDYLAEKVQIVVNENNDLKQKAENLAKHNDYLAENLEKSINYSEYIAENLDKNIAYSEYIAENLDKNIAYSEYIAENLDKNIAYSEYIAENLDKNIAYSEYIAENLDNSILYSEYLAEHVEGNIAYSEYLAENLDENIQYSEYVAENLDKSITYQGMIVEKLNGSVINESLEDKLPSLQDAGFVKIEESDCESCEEEATPLVEEENNLEETAEVEETEEMLEESNEVEEVEETEEMLEESNEVEEVEEVEEAEEASEESNEVEMTSESKLSKDIDELILEAKKRKASENSDLNFLQFLTKSQVDSFYGLVTEDQEAVKLHINESKYYSQNDVLRLISEALSTKNESLDERLVRLMPEATKAIWENLDDHNKKSILSQARLWPEGALVNESQIENFWSTRVFKTNESSTKKLISHDTLIQEDNISDEEANRILESIKRL